MAIDIKQFLAGYIGGALFSTTDSRDDDPDGNNPYNLDDEFDDVSEKCRAAMLSDCEGFIAANITNLHWLKAKCPQCDDWRLGFLFWLNRAGHGSGFWDEGGGEAGQMLSDACRPYGSFELFGDFDAGVVRSHHYG